MKKTTHWLMLTLCIATLSGCATACRKAPLSYASVSSVATKAENTPTEVRQDRMLIWKADLTLQVANVNEAVKEASAMAERQGGYVEKKSDRGEEAASVTLRIPSKTFKDAVASLESLGKVTHRNLVGEDVTEQYVDVEARLKNMILLRDRLKLHLEKATDVKDIIAIETELNRVQSDIDSMQGRIKSLKGQVDYATVTLDLERKSIKGPLGYFFSGIWWGMEKLFIIRD